MSATERLERILAARWLPEAVDGGGEPWPGISAEGLNSVGGPLVFWLADEGMDDVELRDHIVTLHNACHAIECPPDELEPRVRRLVEALEWALSELYVPNQGSDPEYGLHHQAARLALAEWGAL